MKISLLKLTSLICLILVISSCRKKEIEEDTKIGGCTDIDSPLYNAYADYEDASCLYAYVFQYEITYHPAKDGNDDWDLLFFTDADLILEIKEQDNSNELFGSDPALEDQPHNEPAYWTAPTNEKLLNKIYEWKLWDEDTGSSDDLVASGTFNPIVLAINGTITTLSSDSKTQLVLHYDLAQ